MFVIRPGVNIRNELNLRPAKDFYAVLRHGVCRGRLVATSETGKLTFLYKEVLHTLMKGVGACVMAASRSGVDCFISFQVAEDQSIELM